MCASKPRVLATGPGGQFGGIAIASAGILGIMDLKILLGHWVLLFFFDVRYIEVRATSRFSRHPSNVPKLLVEKEKLASYNMLIKAIA